MVTAAAIKQRARALGFDLCGIAPVDTFPELRFLREWIDLGYHAGMTWLADTADRRADVRRLLPGARSVIVFGSLYRSGSGRVRDAFGMHPNASRTRPERRKSRSMRSARTITSCCGNGSTAS